jgi:acetylornithine aminotransferase
VCAAALSVMDRVQAPGFLEDVAARGEQLRGGLRAALSSCPHVKEVGPGKHCSPRHRISI